jgi:uncharacterized protein
MKINTRTVKEAGQLTVTKEISPEEIDSNPPYGVAYPKPFQCQVNAMAAGTEIVVQGQATGQAQLTCSRCLEEYPQSISVGFETTAGIEQGDVELSGEIAQAVVLALPMKPLCRDQCKGLCPHCGQNLNQGGCSCKPDPIHPDLRTIYGQSKT